MVAGTSRSTPARSLTLALAGIALALALCTVIEVVLLVSGPVEPAWVIVLFPMLAWMYIAAGLVAWRRRPRNRVGAILVAGGIAWLAAGLVNTGVPPLIVVGQVTSTLPFAVIVHLVLAFPSGRVAGGAPRLLLAAAYLTTTVLQVTRYLFVDLGPGADLLQIADAPVLDLWAQWVQGVAALLVVTGVTVTVIRRFAAASPSARRVLAPVGLYGIGAVAFIPVSASIVGPLIDIDRLLLVTLQLLVLAGVPVAFAVGLLRGGFARMGEVEELGAWLGAEGGRPELGTALAETLGDPSLETIFWVPGAGGHVDARGLPAALPVPDSGRGHVTVELAGRTVGAIVYDAALIDDAEQVRTAGRVLAIALDRQRLNIELLASREVLRESRTRLVEAGDRERRRIARDLHDGLQGRLVMTAVRTQLLADAAPTPAFADGVAEVRAELDAAIVELRRLVHGVMPALLIERGLFAATEELVDRMPIPTVLELVRPWERLSAPRETAAYFVVAEGLANAMKHARAEHLWVRLAGEGGSLRIELRDDGIGGAGVDEGTGLRGLGDRLDALGGRLSVDSPTGGGTTLTAVVPCAS